MNLPAKIKGVSSAKLPVTYDEAKKALAKCHKIDECKSWKDKMQALASYAKQAGDDALFRYATQIKQRAIRRAGEILAQVEPKHTGRPSKNKALEGHNSRKKAAKTAGLSEKQKRQALQIANIPEKEFEEAIEAETLPTTKQLADRGKKKAAPKPAPYRNEYLDWTGAVFKLTEIPACGLTVLAQRVPSEQPQLLEQAQAAIENLKLWLKELRELP